MSIFKRKQQPIYIMYLDKSMLFATLKIIIENKENIFHYKNNGNSYFELNTVNINPKFKFIPRVVDLVICDEDEENHKFYCFEYLVLNAPVNKWKKFFGKCDIQVFTHTSIFIIGKDHIVTFNSNMELV